MARTRKAVSCPVEVTLAVIGGRWKVLVLQQLLGSVRRFNALHRALRGISHRTLTKQLRELERDGVVARQVFQQIPPKVEYSLTAHGRTLEPILLSMHAWAVKHGTGQTQKAGQIRSVAAAMFKPAPSDTLAACSPRTTSCGRSPASPATAASRSSKR